MDAFILFVALLTQILTFAIVIRALLSWFPVDPTNPLVVILVQITDPILEPMRRVIPRIGMFDLTPIFAILLLQFIGQAVRQSV